MSSLYDIYAEQRKKALLNPRSAYSSSSRLSSLRTSARWEEENKTPFQKMMEQMKTPEDVKEWDTKNTLGKIYEMSEYDKYGASQLYGQFLQGQKDKTSRYYNPYTTASNQAVGILGSLGYDVSNIDDEWFDKNRWMMDHYIIGDTTNTPQKPGKDATAEQWAGYEYYQLYKQNDLTKQAEQERDALQNELTYWANRKDRNYSDEEILGKIDWSKYGTLTSMKEAAKMGAPLELNRGVDISDAWMSGVLWAARNGGGTGDSFTDIARGAIGYGNKWQKNQAIADKLDPTSENYSPYSVGSTMDEAGLYFGKASFDQKWIDENKYLLKSNDKTAVDMYRSVVEAEEYTQKLETQLDHMNKRIDTMLKNNSNPDSILKMLKGNDEFSDLFALDKSMKTGKLKATTRAVNYSWGDIERDIRKRCEEKSKQDTPDTLVDNISNGMSTSTPNPEAKETPITNTTNGTVTMGNGQERPKLQIDVWNEAARLRMEENLTGKLATPGDINDSLEDDLVYRPKRDKNGNIIKEEPVNAVQTYTDKDREAMKAAYDKKYGEGAFDRDYESAMSAEEYQAWQKENGQVVEEEEPEPTPTPNAGPTRPPEYTLQPTPGPDAGLMPEKNKGLVARNGPQETPAPPTFLTETQKKMEEEGVKNIETMAPTVTEKGTDGEKVALQTGKTTIFNLAANAIRGYPTKLTAMMGNLQNAATQMGKILAKGAQQNAVNSYMEQERLVYDHEKHQSNRDAMQEELDKIAPEWDALIARNANSGAIAGMTQEQYDTLIAYRDMEEGINDDWDYIRYVLDNPDSSQVDRDDALITFYNLITSDIQTGEGGVDIRSMGLNNADALLEKAQTWYNYMNRSNGTTMDEIIREIEENPDESGAEEVRRDIGDYTLVFANTGNGFVFEKAIPNSEELMEYGADQIAEVEGMLGAEDDEFDFLTNDEAARLDMLDQRKRELEERIDEEDAFLTADESIYNEAKAEKDALTKQYIRAATLTGDKDLTLLSDMEYLYKVGHEFVPTEYLSNNVFDQAVYDGWMTREDAVRKANETVQDSMTEAQRLQDTLRRADEMGIQISDEERKNIQRRIDLCNRQALESGYFTLDDEADFADVSADIRDRAANGEFGKMAKAVATGEYKFGIGDILTGLSIGTATLAIQKRDRIERTMEAMTEEEKNRYFYLLGTDGEEAAGKYLEMLTDETYGVLNTRRSQAVQESVREYAQSGGLNAAVATASSFISNVLGGANAVFYTLRQKITGQEIGAYNPAFDMSNVTSAARQGTKELISNTFGEGTIAGKLIGLTYDAFCSAVDSQINAQMVGSVFELANGVLEGTKFYDVINKALEGGYGKGWKFVAKASTDFTHASSMGLNAAANAYREAIMRGGNDEQALQMAFATFFAETMSEAITVGNIHDALAAGGDEAARGLSSFLKELFSNGAEEFLGEGVNSWIEENADKVIMGNLSNYQEVVDKYTALGYPESLARKYADQEVWKNVLEGAATGFLSSAMGTSYNYALGAVASRVNVPETMQQGIAQNNTTQQEITEDVNLDEAPAAPEAPVQQETQDQTEDQAEESAAEPTAEQIEAQAQQDAADQKKLTYEHDLNVLTQAEESNATAAAMAIAAIWNSGDDNTNRAVGQALVAKFADGNHKKALRVVQDLLAAGYAQNIDMKQILTVATMTEGGGNQALQKVFELYDGDVTDDMVKYVVDSVQNDMNFANVDQQVADSVKQSRIDNRVVENMQTGEAGKKVADAQAKADEMQTHVDNAQAGLEEAEAKAQAAAENLQAAEAEYDPSPDRQETAANLDQALTEVKNAVTERSQREIDVQGAQENAEAAKAELEAVQDETMTELRQQATAEVEQEMAAEAEQQAQAEEQARIEAEQQAAEQQAREETDDMSTMDADTFIKTYFPNATKKEQGQIRKRIREMQTEITDSLARRGQFVKQISNKFGIQIDIEDTTNNGRVSRQNGYYDRRTGRIVLDQNSTVSDAMYAVLGHELTHVAEQSSTYKDLANSLLRMKYGADTDLDTVLKAMNGDGDGSQLAADIKVRKTLYDTRLAEMHAQDESIDATPLTPEEAAQEIVADLMGDLLHGNQDLMNRFANEQPSVARRVLDTIKNFLKKTFGMKGAWTKEMMNTVQMLEGALNEVQGQQAADQEGRKYHISQADAQAIQNQYPSSAVKVQQNHTKEQLDTVEDYLDAVDERVLEAAKTYEADKNAPFKRISVGDVSEREASEIQSMFGYDVTGYKHDVDRSFFEHVEKRHGKNGEHDQTMSDLNDVARVGWVIKNYDRITSKPGDVSIGYTDKNNNPMPLICYEKKIDGTLYVVEAVGENKWKKLHVVSAYMQKNNSASNNLPNSTAPYTPHASNGLGPDVRNAHTSAVSDMNVAQNQQTVKPVVQDSQGNDLLSEMPGGTMVVDRDASYSLSSFTPEEQTKVRQALLASGEFSEEDVDKYLDNALGLASMIAADRLRLDYEADPEKTMLKPNAEYVKTLDASTLCAKRLLYQGTFDAIQHALPNTPLMPEDLIDLANLMREMGYETPCGICYVESRRRNLGKFADQWLESYDGEYKPTLDQVTTSDGLEELRHSHPETYRDFVAAMNKKGTMNPKVVQPRTDYRGEIRSMTPREVQKVKDIGGLRVQSFSDFEVPHLLDMTQAIMDMAARGLTSQAYTKVPNFAWAFGDTGIKINLSLIGAGEGVDENGNLIFDDVEGMPFEEAMKLRDRYSKNVGTILVGINDEHILAAMADDRIDFIIPFHKSGWSKEELNKMPVLNSYSDYTDSQNERAIIGRAKNGEYKTESLEKTKRVNFQPVGENGYWDFSKSGKENAETYLRMCAEDGRLPKFSQFLVDNGDGSFSLQPDGSTDGYWKTLIDFKMYDNDGNGSPQMPVAPNINMAEATRMLNEYSLDRNGISRESNNSLPVAQPVVDRYVEEYKEKHPRKKYSLDLNQDYAKAVENGDMESAQNDVDEAAEIALQDSKIRGEDGKLLTVYHGTHEDFNVFDTSISGGKNGIAEGYGIYLTDSREVSDAYGDKKISAYLDMKRPAYGDQQTIRRNELAKVIKATCEQDARQMVADGDYGSVKEALPDTWISNYVYTPEFSNISAAYSKVAEMIIEQNGNDADIVREVMAGMGIRDYERAMDFYHNILTPLTGIDGFIQEWKSARDGSIANVYLAFDSSQIKKNDPVTYDDQGNVIPLNERFNTTNRDIRYSLPEDYDYIVAAEHGEGDQYALQEDMESTNGEETQYGNRRKFSLRVTDPNELNFLNNQETITTYKTMQLIDGKLYPPMAAVVDGAMEDYSVLGEWEKATEHPELIKKGNKFTLNKGKGQGSLDAAYNPYMHSSNLMINDQFSGAYHRPNLVTVECQVPVSESNGAYHAEYAKDDTGWHGWHTGPVASLLRQNGTERQVFLSRWIKPVRIIPDSEVAQHYAGLLKGTNIAVPDNVVSPSLLAELEKAGVPISESGRVERIKSYSLPSQPEMDQLIQRYFAAGGSLSVPNQLDTQTITPGMATPVKTKKRQFGSKTSQESDALHQDVKEYLYSNSDYTPDQNGAQISRAITWVQSHANESDTDGFYGALTETESADFDMMSADGQARMLTLMSMAAQKAEETGDHSIEQRIANAYNQQGTSIAQALQARKIFRLMTPLGRQATLQKEADNINDQYAKQGKSTRVKVPDDILREAGEAKTEEDFEKVRKKAAKALAEQMPPNWKDRLRSWRMLSMLGNPRTHIRNILGNALFEPAVAIKNKLGAVGEIVTRQKERTKTLAPMVSSEIRNFAKQDAVAIKDQLTGEAKYNEETMVERERNAFNGVLQKLSDFNSNALEAEDWHFLRGHYTRALGGWMQANGYTVEEVQSDPELLDKGRQYAIQEAQKATYRDFSKIASTLNKLSREGGAAGFAVDAVLPFKKTPANILKRGMEYSPLGIAKSLTADAYHLKQYMDYQNGKLSKLPDKAISPNEFIDHLCSGLTGTAILAVGALLADAGIVSCGLGDDDDEFEKLRGNQEYAVRVNMFGHDVTFTMDWAAPMSMPFFVGAAIANQMQNQEGFDIEELVNAFGNITEPVFNLSMLDGVNSLLSVSQYGDDPNGAITQIGAKVLSNYATSYVPSLSGAIARTVDTTRRKAFVESGKGSGVLGTFRYAMEQTENKIPGLSQSNIPYRDVWGNPEESGLAERILENFILPGYVDDYQNDPVVDELERLYQATGETDMIPSDPGKTVTYNKEKYILTAEQWDELKVARGQAAYNAFQEMIGNEYYQNASLSDKHDMMAEVWTYANEVGKKTVIPDMDTKYGDDPVQQIVNKFKKKAVDNKVAADKKSMLMSLESGDYEAYETMVESLHQSGYDDAKIKETIADKYRDVYKTAYRSYKKTGEEDYYARMLELEEMLDYTGLNFSYSSWRKQVDKESLLIEEDTDDDFDQYGK